MSDLIKRLRDGLIEYDKRWCGDTHDDKGGPVDYEATDALMAEAATALTEAEAEIVRLRGALDDIYRHVDWWSTWRISSHIRAALSRPHATKGDEG